MLVFDPTRPLHAQAAPLLLIAQAGKDQRGLPRGKSHRGALTGRDEIDTGKPGVGLPHASPV